MPTGMVTAHAGGEEHDVEKLAAQAAEDAAP
jgi:hypothetical protein